MRLPRALRELDFETAREAARDREVPDHEESELAIELDAEEAERHRRLEEIAKDISNEQLFTQEDFDRIKYETPLVKQLRTVEVKLKNCFCYISYVIYLHILKNDQEAHKKVPITLSIKKY